jgi:hypothetical protein
VGDPRFALNFGALRDGDFVRVAGVAHADLSKQETCASRVLACC